MGPPQRRHEQLRDPLEREPVRDRPRLLEAVLGQIRIATAVDKRKPGTRKGDLRGAVADQDDLGGALRKAERRLLVRAVHRRCAGAGQGVTSTLIDSSFWSWTENASPICSSGLRWVTSGPTSAAPVLSSRTASLKSSLV